MAEEKTAKLPTRPKILMLSLLASLFNDPILYLALISQVILRM